MLDWARAAGAWAKQSNPITDPRAKGVREVGAGLLTVPSRLSGSQKKTTNTRSAAESGRPPQHAGSAGSAPKGPGRESPLVADARLAAGAEQACSAVHVALNERGEALTEIEIEGQNAAAAHLAAIGVGQNIVALKSRAWNETATDDDIVIGEPGQGRRH